MSRRVSFGRYLELFCFGLIFMGQSINADAQTPQEIAKKAFPSVVLLVMEDANGQPVSLGSGFFVRDGEIASNLHVVEGALRGYAKVLRCWESAGFRRHLFPRDCL
jgi:S1-C subfamily serine protease